MKFLFLIFIFCSSLSGPSVVAQDSVKNKIEEIKYPTEPAPDPVDFNEEKIESLKDSPEFNYERDTEISWWTKFKRYVSLKWNNFLHWLFGDYETGGLLAYFLSLLPYLLLLAIIILAAWLFSKINPQNIVQKKTKSPGVILDEEERIVKTENIDILIKKAEEEKQFRLAVRYNFLLILRKFDEKGEIDYQSSKTDEDYLAEIKQEKFLDQFRRLIRIYEFVWYGKNEPTSAEYQKISIRFEKMSELIKEKNE